LCKVFGPLIEDLGASVSLTILIAFRLTSLQALIKFYLFIILGIYDERSVGYHGSEHGARRDCSPEKWRQTMSAVSSEKMLVCVNGNPAGSGVVRYAARKAAAAKNRLFAVYVETPCELLTTGESRERAMDNLRLAEELGAQTTTLAAKNVADEAIRFAREKSITRIIAGKPARSRLKSLFGGSPVDSLVRRSDGIAVEIVSGDSGEAAQKAHGIGSQQIPWSDYGSGLLFYALATGLSLLMYPHFDLSNLIMIYLLAVLVTAIESGRGPAIVISFLSVLTFDFLFVPPRFSFTVDDAQFIVTFSVMFAVALVISHLASLMRAQTRTARLHERQAAAMHGLSRQLACSRGGENIVKVAVDYISEIFDSPMIVLLPDGAGKLKTSGGDPSPVLQNDLVRQLDIARTSFESGKTTGWGSEYFPENEILYAPLQVAELNLGVVALRPGDPERFLLPEQRSLLESLVKQVALSLEVEYMAQRGIPLQASASR
jgi:two-component system sensor histidine kinase KdpD